MKGIRWALTNWNAFIVMAWMVINLSVGSRKGESTKLPGDESSNDWFTRRSLTWNISEATVVDPSEAQLRSLKEGDFARLSRRKAPSVNPMAWVMARSRSCCRTTMTT